MRSRQLRYRKRTVSVLCTVSGAAEVAAFYAFLHHCKGRYQAFRYQHFTDDRERTWRLASDDVALTFRRPDLVECQLRMTHLENE